MRLRAQIADKKEHEKKKGTIDSIALSVFVDKLAEFDKSEANPKNNLMMRRAGLPRKCWMSVENIFLVKTSLASMMGYRDVASS